MPTPEFVSKPLSARVADLLQSLQVVRDSLDGLARQQQHQVIPLAGQLRALLVEKSRGNDPLLLSVAETFGANLELFHMPGTDHPPPIEAKPILHLAGGPFTRFKEFPAQVPVALKDLLALQLLSFNNESYTVGSIVEHFANKAGGAHYARRLPKNVRDLLSVSFNGRSVVGEAIRQIGEGVLAAGADFVSQLSDVTLYADLAAVEPSEGYLLDYQYPNSPMRLSLRLDKRRRLVGDAVGIDGWRLSARIPEEIAWNEPHRVKVSVLHNARLNTSMELALDDGTIRAEESVPSPVFITAQIHDYEMFVNRASDSPSPSGISVAMGQILVLGRSTPMEHARVDVWLADTAKDPNRSAILFTSGSFGHAPSGTSSLEMTGTVRRSTMSDAFTPAPEDDAQSA